VRHLETYGTIISKAEADKIFSFTRSVWDAYAAHLSQPEGWRIRPLRDDAGTLVTASDPDTGRVLSIQPRYRDESHTLDRLVIASHYPIGRMPSFPPDLKKIERAAQKTLGFRYSASVSYSKSASLESVDLTLTLADTVPSREQVREDRTILLANNILASGSEHMESRSAERGSSDAYGLERTALATAISPDSPTTYVNSDGRQLKTFVVYRHSIKGYEAVKVGFAWPALVVRPICMLAKRLLASLSLTL